MVYIYQMNEERVTPGSTYDTVLLPQPHQPGSASITGLSEVHFLKFNTTSPISCADRVQPLLLAESLPQ